MRKLVVTFHIHKKKFFFFFFGCLHILFYDFREALQRAADSDGSVRAEKLHELINEVSVFVQSALNLL